MTATDSANGNKSQILIVDDDPSIRDLLRTIFEENDFCVSEAHSIASAVDTVSKQKIDLVTLDLRLGKEDGLEATRLIRRVRDVPIIMITARADDIDRIVGLEVGADDYIVKPFNVREVLARARAVLRRVRPTASQPCEANAQLTFGDYSLSTDQREVRSTRTGDRVALTGAEFNLLKTFAERKGRILTRNNLLDLLQQEGATEPFDRAIDTLVARLRRKIEPDTDHPIYIKTVRGIGYVFVGGQA